MTPNRVLWMVDENSTNTTEPDSWARLLAFEGTPSTLWNVNHCTHYNRGRTPECPHDLHELAGYELFRLETQATSDPGHGYGATPDEILEEAAHRYSWALQVLETARREQNVRWLVTRGSSTLARRAALFAAEDLGIETYCIEDGLFQVPHEHRGAMACIVLTPRRAYYEEYPPEWIEPRRSYDRERWDAYHRWWMTQRRTKYSGQGPHEQLMAPGDLPLDPDFLADEKRTVWFGQLQGDASLYWNAPPGIPEDAFSPDVWYKAHPFGVRGSDVWPRKELRWLPPEASVHQILPLCDTVAGITTNVCLEAWMYRRKVAVYGQPWYAATGLCDDVIDDFSPAPIDHEARFALLDWFVHEVQIARDDGPRFVARLHGEVGAEAVGTEMLHMMRQPKQPDTRRD
jgi:hypothetical protein